MAITTRYRVRIAQRAQNDLEAIFDYIAKDSPGIAKQFTVGLLEAIGSLDLFPHRHRRIGSTSIRSMSVRPYLIRYRIDEASRTAAY